MNLASTVVIVVILALAGLAGWRWYRKGQPCSCGRGGKCEGCGHCHGDHCHHDTAEGHEGRQL